MSVDDRLHVVADYQLQAFDLVFVCHNVYYCVRAQQESLGRLCGKVRYGGNLREGMEGNSPRILKNRSWTLRKVQPRPLTGAA